MAKEGKIRTLVSGYIVDEVRRSLARKASVLLPHFENLLQAEVLTIVADPTAEEVVVAGRIISDPKDAPIIAAAMRHRVDYLVTLDRKDFLSRSEVSAKSGINILLPQDFLHFLREAAKI